MKKSSMKHEHISISTIVKDQFTNGCFLVDETINELIYPKAFQVKSDSSSVSFCVRYQTILRITHQNLHGHKFNITHERPNPVLQIEHKIPKQFLVSQETCLVHVMIVLSEMRLPPSIQERLVRYISTEAVDYYSRRCRQGGRGFRVEVNVQVNVDRWVRVRCGNDNSCEVEARELKERDCAICLTELSSMVSRMELQCCHVFHSDCVLKWLNKNPSCPTCRTKTLGETISVF